MKNTTYKSFSKPCSIHMYALRAYFLTKQIWFKYIHKVTNNNYFKFGINTSNPLEVMDIFSIIHFTKQQTLLPGTLYYSLRSQPRSRSQLQSPKPPRQAPYDPVRLFFRLWALTLTTSYLTVNVLNSVSCFNPDIVESHGPAGPLEAMVEFHNTPATNLLSYKRNLMKWNNVTCSATPKTSAWQFNT